MFLNSRSELFWVHSDGRNVLIAAARRAHNSATCCFELKKSSVLCKHHVTRCVQVHPNGRGSLHAASRLVAWNLKTSILVTRPYWREHCHVEIDA